MRPAMHTGCKHGARGGQEPIGSLIAMERFLTTDGAEPKAIIAVGQLSCDTVVTLDGPLAARDHNPGSALSMPGGTAAIVAHNVAALGGRPVFTGQVGDGIEDQNAARALRDAGVAIGPLTRASRGLRVVIVVEPDGERTMFAAGDPPRWAGLELPARPGDIVFFEGWHLLGEAPDADYIALIRQASDRRAVVALDVCTANNAGSSHRELLADLPIDVLLANSVEANALGLLSAPTSPVVIVHRGCEPTVLLMGSERREFPVDVVTPVDTSGAGDTFAAGFLLAIQNSAITDDAVRRGLAAARQIVRIPGPLLPARQQTATQSESIAI